ncbi:DUF2797 domain-containing protein [Paeniglutamicibacter cryotolerans]|uniref:DUF2797 domain-containing protein n=1 Tax=Paeniglutamicibacter cryotolerans TaxID=670079 RepID=A0A839QD36_9MICC|nr:DUF2797 domain-containing protein [Paeniglutamicibacter cryotolerans]MBB2994049.1 hypothetical protein [Paeniglutamicibacter cryotolerans]
MTGALNCHGISWPASDGTAALALRTAAGDDRRIALEPGTRLGFRVLPGRWCLGHVLVHGVGERTSVPCPEANQVAYGTQCALCLSKDQSRAMHDFHRSGIASPGLRAYLAQPHWLYVATFAHGVSKVGTAAQGSKWRRLAEQGAVAAQYVALAPDGAIVRRLEDRVSERFGMVQGVRAKAKTAGLLGYLPQGSGADSNHPARLNQIAVQLVAALLDQLYRAGELDFRPVAESWVHPALADPILELLGSGEMQPYPWEADHGRHGFTVCAVLGQGLLVRLDGSDLPFLLDAAALKGRRVEPGDFSTRIPVLQESLF